MTKFGYLLFGTTDAHRAYEFNTLDEAKRAAESLTRQTGKATVVFQIVGKYQPCPEWVEAPK